MALPWIFDHFLRKSGGTMSGGLTLSDGSAAEGVVVSGTGYIRYARGIQMCWGTANLNGPVTEKNKRVSFPKAFKRDYIILTTHNANVGSAPVGIGWESSTSFSIGTLDNSGSTAHTGWLAIGYWK